MGRVYRPLKLIGVKGSAEVKALFDTGASRTFINEEIAEKIGYLRFPTAKEVLTAAKAKRLKVTGILDFDTEIEGCKVTAPAYVSPELVEETVIGVDLMEAHNIKIDPKAGKIDLSEFVELMILSVSRGSLQGSGA